MKTVMKKRESINREMREKLDKIEEKLSVMQKNAPKIEALNEEMKELRRQEKQLIEQRQIKNKLLIPLREENNCILEQVKAMMSDVHTKQAELDELAELAKDV
jgi:uncharacterized coiled-coil DUF342 family protein